MHDALARYEPDTVVEDVPDDPPASPAMRVVRDGIARSRVPTGELEMHVQLDDGWHRSSPDGTETACELHIDIRYQLATRNGRTVEHPLALCQCWTDGEWRKADTNWNAKYLRPYDGPRRKP